MTDLLAQPPLNATLATSGYPTQALLPVRQAFPLPFALPPGSLRIGGDSPDGLVLSGGAPAARTVRLLDMETGQLVAETVSSGAGTYAFSGLSDRTEGYAVWIVGDTGEAGLILPGIHPGSP